MEHDVRTQATPIEARLLFVSASPRGRNPVMTEREFRDVIGELESSPAWQACVTHRPAAIWKRMVKDLRSLHPSIIHFAGHGYPDGSLEFVTVEGSSHRVQSEALVRLFWLHARHVRLVVLNACYSAALAVSLTQHVDAVVGVPHAFPDELAIHFAAMFYGQLAAGLTVQAAFDDAYTDVLGRYQDAGAAQRDVLGGESSELPLSLPLPELHVRAGVNAAAMWFTPPGGWSGPAPIPRGDAASKAEFDRRAATRALLRETYERLLTGYTADAIDWAAMVVEASLKILVGKPDVRASLAELAEELRRSGKSVLHRDVRWLDAQRTATEALRGQIRGEIDDEARRASEIAERLARAADLVTEAELVARKRDARAGASEAMSGALLQLDRKLHRRSLEERLVLPGRVVALLVHGESDQGHDHFEEVVTWRLRSDPRLPADEVVVDWPDRWPSLGNRLGMLFEDIRNALDLKLELPADNPLSADGARAWRPALAAIVDAIDTSRRFLRHVIRSPTTGRGGDDELLAAYLGAVWTPLARRAGERIVVGFDVRRGRDSALPLSPRWRAARAERRATELLAGLLHRFESEGLSCVLPELTSVAEPDLADWLRASGDPEPCDPTAPPHDRARELVSATRGGRFDLVLQRLTASNPKRSQNTP